jgi:hypothetical protein
MKSTLHDFSRISSLALKDTHLPCALGVLRLTRTCIFPDNGTLSKMSPLWPKLHPQVLNNNQIVLSMLQLL